MAVKLKTRPQTRLNTSINGPTHNTPLVVDFSFNGVRNGNRSGISAIDIMEPVADEGESIYGWRTVVEVDEHGNEKVVQIPLTLEEYLHPQEGDNHMQTQSHNQIIEYIIAVIRLYLRHRQGVAIYNDVGIDWNIPGLRHYAPDVSVIFNIRNPERPPQKIFYVRDEGTEPSLVVEVTSKSTRHVDLDRKIDLYARVGIPFYFIVDAIGRNDDDTPILRLIGFELTPNGYVELQPNEHGWLWMPPIEAWLGLDDGQVRCYDVQGNELPTPEGLADGLAETSEQLTEETVAREGAERRAEEAERRAEEAERRAEDAECQATEELRLRQGLEEQIRTLQAQLKA